MEVLEICIGSACYVKGSNQLVEEITELLKEEGWSDKVQLKGSFCMNYCQNEKGLGIRLNGHQLEMVTIVNAKDLIREELKKIL